MTPPPRQDEQEPTASRARQLRLFAVVFGSLAELAVVLGGGLLLADWARDRWPQKPLLPPLIVAMACATVGLLVWRVAKALRSSDDFKP